jgi:hypothetical protein
MPVSDGCRSERDAHGEALDAADEFLEEYFEAREQLLEMLEQIEEDIDLPPAVEDAWNHADNLGTAWEITMDEADALREELEVCLHDLNETILTP